MIGGFFRGLLGSGSPPIVNPVDASSEFPSGYEIWGDINHAANLLEGICWLCILQPTAAMLLTQRLESLRFFSVSTGAHELSCGER